jgi:hypothetical protein
MKENRIMYNCILNELSVDCFCVLVVRVPGYGSRGPRSIPGATRFSEKYWVWKRAHSLVSTTEELLKRKSRGSDLENREYGRRHRSR